MPKGVPNKRHTGAFKQMVIETMMRDKLSYRGVARKFEISGREQIRKWERIYLMEGPEGLYVERRGPGTKARIQTRYAAGNRSITPVNILLS